MAKQKARESQTPVLVTTAHKGVFFGYAAPNSKFDEPTIVLDNARMCVYWSQDMRGIMGLASMGPSSTCKIGPRVKSITLRDVTAVIEVSAEAVEKWEVAPWSK